MTLNLDRLIGLNRVDGKIEYRRQVTELRQREEVERAVAQHMELGGLEGLTGARLLVSSNSDRPRFRLEWDDGDFVQCHVNGTWLHFDYLVSQDDQHRTTQLLCCLPEFFRSRGITHFSTTSSDATVAMLRVGFEWVGGYLLADISEGGRVDQWVSWKRGDSPEPEWHQQLGKEQ